MNQSTMATDDNRSTSSHLKRIWSLVFDLINSDAIKLVVDVVKLMRSVTVEQADGLYEVLDFDHTLELRDTKGEVAVYHKRETVKLLQDHVAAYLDQAWGRGEIFADYQCSPGTPVDRYRCGRWTCTLISLREVRRRGEVLRISIDRTVKNGFDLKTGWSETIVRHKTRRFRIAVIFPAKRLPTSVDLVEVNGNRTTPLGERNVEEMPDGRRKVFWETQKPKLFETYVLKWAW
jgi:hypothetical protein